MTLKIKYKNYLDETVFYTILYNEKIIITGVFLRIKDPDPGDPKRPDPTGSGSGSYLDMFLMFSKINIFL